MIDSIHGCARRELAHPAYSRYSCTAYRTYVLLFIIIKGQWSVKFLRLRGGHVYLAFKRLLDVALKARG
jgi:hypothetical protein